MSLGLVLGLSLAWVSVSPWLALGWALAYLIGFAAGAFVALLFPVLLTAVYALPAALEGCSPTAHECYSGVVVGGALLLGGSFALAMLAGILARRYIARYRSP